MIPPTPQTTLHRREHRASRTSEKPNDNNSYMLRVPHQVCLRGSRSKTLLAIKHACCNIRLAKCHLVVVYVLPNISSVDFEEGLLLQEGLGLVSFQGECVPRLFYADDLLLMSGSEAGLQRQLDYVQRYAAHWRLTVNVSKTKAMVFGGRGRGSQRAYPELAELGRFPLLSFVGKLAASMWRRLVLMEEERLVKKAFNASLALARQQGGAAAGKGSSWVAHMAAFFEEIGPNVGLDSDRLSRWSPDFVEKILQQRHLQRLRDAAGSKTKDYIGNMWGSSLAMAEYKMQPFLRVLDDSRKRVLFAQFRTGSHWLRVEADASCGPSLSGI
jgi:hypothetical protein